MAKMVDLRNGRTWTTQKSALQHFKDMLHRYRNGEIVSSHADMADLSALLTIYDEKRGAGEPSKVGEGIDYIKRLNNEVLGWPTDGFWIFRLDGTSIDFSYISAVKSATVK